MTEEWLLDDPGMISTIRKEFETRIAGESDNTLLLFLSVLSTIIKTPFPTIIEAPSSTGKSYIAETVIAQFPEFTGDFTCKDFCVVPMNNYTEAGLTRVSEINPLFFDNKFLYLAELPDANSKGKIPDEKLTVVQCIRQLLSEGRYDKILAGEGKKHEPKLLSLRGKPNALALSAYYMAERQYRNRHVIINLDENKRQTEAVLNYQCKNPWEVPPKRSPYIWKLVQQYLQSNREGYLSEIEVYNPYRYAVGKMFTTLYSEELQVKRVHEHVKAVINTLAILHHVHREWVQVPGQEGPKLVASYDDNLLALQLMKEAVELSITSIKGKYLRYYDLLEESFTPYDKDGQPNWFTVKQAAEKLELADRTTRKILNNLSIDGGLLEKKEEGKRNSYCLKAELGKSSLTRSQMYQTALENSLKPEELPDGWVLMRSHDLQYDTKDTIPETARPIPKESQ